MKNFKELLMEALQKGKTVDEKQARHKMSVLDEIDGMMGGEMANKLKGLKKVTVAAPDEESLQEGLDIAKEKVGEMEEMDEEKESEEIEPESMSKEEIIAKIEELKAALAEKEE